MHPPLPLSGPPTELPQRFQPHLPLGVATVVSGVPRRRAAAERCRTGCPPFFCVVGSDEVLLDDSVRLVRGGGIAGVDARLWIAAGMQHVFPIWKGAFPEADAAIATIASWISERIA
jgi:acetyl esterase/lipase